jgi:hypothetical protein
MPFAVKDWLRFAFVTWPDQMVRLISWQSVELIQQHFPDRLGRRPGQRMIIDEPFVPAHQAERV